MLSFFSSPFSRSRGNRSASLRGRLGELRRLLPLCDCVNRERRMHKRGPLEREREKGRECLCNLSERFFSLLFQRGVVRGTRGTKKEEALIFFHFLPASPRRGQRALGDLSLEARSSERASIEERGEEALESRLLFFFCSFPTTKTGSRSSSGGKKKGQGLFLPPPVSSPLLSFFAMGSRIHPERSFRERDFPPNGDEEEEEGASSLFSCPRSSRGESSERAAAAPSSSSLLLLVARCCYCFCSPIPSRGDLGQKTLLPMAASKASRSRSRAEASSSSSLLSFSLSRSHSSSKKEKRKNKNSSSLSLSLSFFFSSLQPQRSPHRESHGELSLRRQGLR